MTVQPRKTNIADTARPDAMNPRTVLQERYPAANLMPYFGFLEWCKGTQSGPWRTHEHHILPRKQFPEYADCPENLITLTVEDHAHAHRVLEAVCGIKAPPSVLLESLTWTPERAAKRSATAKLINARPEVKARVSKQMKAYFADPAARARHSATLKKAHSRPETKARTSAALKKFYADNPEALQKMRAVVKAAAKPPVLTFEQRSASATKYWNSPEGRALNSATQKAAKNRPDQIARASSKAKAFWARKRAERILCDVLIAEVTA
jgi:hypothetical protein